MEPAAPILGDVALGEISKDLCLFSGNARDLLGQLLNLPYQVLLPHEVLVRV